jgi:hypothetical protein
MEQADCDRKSNEFLPGTSRAPFCRSRNTRVSDRLPTARRRYGPTAAAYSCGAPRALPADLQAIIDRGRGEVRLRRTYRDQSAGLAATAGGNPRSGEPIHCKLVPISGLPATKQGLGTTRVQSAGSMATGAVAIRPLKLLTDLGVGEQREQSGSPNHIADQRGSDQVT